MNINRIFNFISVFCFILVMGCQKSSNFLEVEPHNNLTSESFWSSEKDALRELTTCYINAFGGFNPWEEETASDNAYGQFDWGSPATVIAKGTVKPNSDVVNNKWDDSYTAIRSCNFLLENLDKVPFTTPGLKDGISAQARFIRAWQYLYLAFNFANVPIVTKTLSVEESKQVKPTPQDSVYQFVLSELEAASKSLPVSYTSEEGARITKGACYGLEARAYLYQRNFPKVLSVIEKIDDLNIYALNTEGPHPYDDLFSGGNQRNNEVILSVQKTQKTGKLGFSNAANADMMMKGIGGADPYYMMWATGSLSDAYPMADGRLIHESGSAYDAHHPYENRDPRLKYTIFCPGDTMPTYENGSVVWKEIFDPEDQSLPLFSTAAYSYVNGSRTGLTWRKYLDLTPWGYENVWDCQNDVILMRYAEIILMKAEALLEVNGASSKSEVINIIDALRDRCGGGDVHEENYNSEEELMKLVRNERRVELANEGLRYYDIIRWKTAEKDPVTDGVGLNGILYGAYMRLDGDGKNDRTVSIDGVPRRYIMTNSFDESKRYLLPIPQKELDMNKNLKQNTGW